MKQYEADEQRKLFQWVAFIRTEHPEAEECLIDKIPELSYKEYFDKE